MDVRTVRNLNMEINTRDYWYLLRYDSGAVVVLRNGIDRIYECDDVKSGTSEKFKGRE